MQQADLSHLESVLAVVIEPTLWFHSQDRLPSFGNLLVSGQGCIVICKVYHLSSDVGAPTVGDCIMSDSDTIEQTADQFILYCPKYRHTSWNHCLIPR